MEGDRIDTVLERGDKYTRKEMDNGEVRTRLQVKGLASLSVTSAEHWPTDGPIPWQQAHYHEGQTEVYTLIDGWACFLWLSGILLVSIELCNRPGQTMIFKPGEAHNVLLGPGAKLSTVIFGEPVGNPDRKGNDWWPVEGAVYKSFLAAQERAVKQVMNRTT